MSDSPIKYRLIKKEKHTGARLGEIITPHGTFPTPMFMPVGTQATVKTQSPEEIERDGFRDYPIQHLSLVASPWGRTHCPCWRSSQVYELGPTNLNG